jgi:hypothetical protein
MPELCKCLTIVRIVIVGSNLPSHAWPPFYLTDAVACYILSTTQVNLLKLMHNIVGKLDRL